MKQNILIIVFVAVNCVLVIINFSHRKETLYTSLQGQTWTNGFLMGSMITLSFPEKSLKERIDLAYKMPECALHIGQSK